MAEVVLTDVGKVYADGTRAVDGLSVDISDGEFLVLVGPSGCGKTTALRMVAGLEEISEGTVRIGGQVVNGIPSRDRDVAMVFQSYALYPHLDVYENMAFGLRLRKVAKPEAERRVAAAAGVLGLRDLLRRKPRALSGGQRQRVAMGRAIVREPSAFLMDEPLSNLDAKLRVQLRAEIARTQRQLGATTIYVTHDQTEAMTLGHRVAVLKRGLLQQVARPQELYERPVNLFVAGFIGSPPMNLVYGVFDEEPVGLAVTLGNQRVPVDHALLVRRPGLRRYFGRRIVVGIRPEDLRDATLPGAVAWSGPNPLNGTNGGAGPAGAASGAVLTGAAPLTGFATGTALTERALLLATADLVESLGSDVLVHFGIAGAPVVTDDTRELAIDAGADPAGPATAGATTVLVARFSPRTRVQSGDRVEVAVDTARLHVFDPDTGFSIW